MHTKLVHEATEDSITVSIVSDGGKNTVFLVTGIISSPEDSVFDIIDVARLGGKPSNVRLDSLVFMVESGLKVQINYRNQPYVLPLEGRSKIDLGWVDSLAILSSWHRLYFKKGIDDIARLFGFLVLSIGNLLFLFKIVENEPGIVEQIFYFMLMNSLPVRESSPTLLHSPHSPS